MDYSIVKSVPIRIGRISLTEKGFVIFDFKDDTMINSEDTDEMRAVVEELTELSPKPMIVLTGDRMGTTKEAREKPLKTDPDLSLCEAIVIRSLPTRIAGMFFYKIYSPEHPYKFFSNQSEAFEWAEKIYNEHLQSQTQETSVS